MEEKPFSQHEVAEGGRRREPKGRRGTRETDVDGAAVGALEEKEEEGNEGLNYVLYSPLWRAEWLVRLVVVQREGQPEGERARGEH